MDLELTGKKAIVTGGSVGIGKATARELAREGVDVAICARRQDVLEQAAAELASETGRRIIPIVADTTSTESVNAMVARAEDIKSWLDARSFDDYTENDRCLARLMFAYAIVAQSVEIYKQPAVPDAGHRAFDVVLEPKM